MTERPDSGYYTMLVVTPSNPINPSAQGIARLDCENANPSSIAAAFTNNVTDPEIVAFVVS